MAKHKLHILRHTALAATLVASAACSTTNDVWRGRATTSTPVKTSSPAATPTQVTFSAPPPSGNANLANSPVDSALTISATPNLAIDEPAASPSSESVSRITFAGEGADFDPCVSSDGRILIYASTQHRSTSDIYSKQIGSRVVTRLTSDASDDVSPAISPDGTRIAFASNRSGNWDIYVMPVTGGQAVQVTDDPADDLSPSWSADGSQLVFSRFGESTGRWEMWISSVVGQTAPQFIGFGMFPRWCPVAGTGDSGADRILFQVGRERGSRAFAVWTLDYIDGRAVNLTEIATSTNAACINPCWSPDGQRIVYAEVPTTSANRQGRPASGDLWMISVDGTSKVKLTSGPAANLSPYWAASNLLYFVSARQGKEHIWSIDMGSALLAVGDTTIKPVVARRQQQPGEPATRSADASGK
jgi:dipeptidyl aminopeptidase/acylaminoacyl peptidase